MGGKRDRAIYIRNIQYYHCILLFILINAIFCIMTKNWNLSWKYFIIYFILKIDIKPIRLYKNKSYYKFTMYNMLRIILYVKVSNYYKAVLSYSRWYNLITYIEGKNYIKKKINCK